MNRRRFGTDTTAERSHARASLRKAQPSEQAARLSTSWRRGNVGPAVAATALAIAVGLPLTEWLIARRQPLAFPFHNELQPYVGFGSPPNFAWRSDGPSNSSRVGEQAVVYTNGDGLRIASPDYVLERRKPAGQIRVAVIGGSTVDIGTSFDVSLPGSLKRRIRDRFPGRDVEVINGGIISAIARQQLIHLLLTISEYDIDILMNYDGINDSGQMLYYEKRPNYPYHFHVLEEAWHQYVDDRRTPLWQLVLGRSAIAAAMWPDRFGHSYHTDTVRPEDLIADADLQESYATAYIASWGKIRDVAAAYGIRPFFVLQPTSLYAPPDGHQPRVAVDAALEANRLVYDAYRRAVRRFAAAHPDAGVLDLADFLSDQQYFYDGCHVYDDVNDVIATRLEDLIHPALAALFESRRS